MVMQLLQQTVSELQNEQQMTVHVEAADLTRWKPCKKTGTA